jgi:hypothetical protein
MAYKFLIFILSLFKIPILYGQECNCKTNLQYVIKTIEQDYAGFFDKASPDDLKYVKFKTTLLRDSKKLVLPDYNCYILLKKFVLYFNDPHLTFGFKTNDERFKKIFLHDPAFYINVLRTIRKKTISPITKKEESTLIGNWIDDGNNLVRISKLNDHVLVGKVIKGDSLYWHYGDTKFYLYKKKKNKFTSIYLTRDHYPREIEAEVLGDEIIFGKFGRAFKGNNFFDEIANFKFEKISDKIYYFRIPNFLPESAPIVDSILENNMLFLKEAEHLIVDVRNNPGGSRITYSPLLPYMGKDTIYIPEVLIRKSEKNIGFYAGFSNDVRYDSIYRKVFREIVKSLKQEKGSFLNNTKNTYFMLDTLLPYPSKISILINQRTSSAAEFFVNEIQGSPKVKIFGATSYGTLDYGEINLNNYLPCGFIRFNYAVTKYKRQNEQPGAGIIPDVYINTQSRHAIQEILKTIEANANKL